jgi:hypothetical protein
MEAAAASVLLLPARKKVLIVALLFLTAGSLARRAASGKSLQKRARPIIELLMHEFVSVWIFELCLINFCRFTNADGVRYDYRAYTEVVFVLSLSLSLSSVFSLSF